MSKKILLICKTREKGFTKYENIRFQEAALELGYQLDMLPFDELKLNDVLNEKYDCILPRIGSSEESEKLIHFLMKLEQNNLKVINSSYSTRLGHDKYESLKMVQSKVNIPIPKTILLSASQNDERVQWSSFPTVAKTRYGAKGSGVFLVQNLDELRMLLEKHSELVVQEYIEESKGQDIRVLVCGNKILDSIMRKSNSGDFRANLALGGEAQPYKIDEKLSRLAIDIARSLGLAYCGCDFLIKGNDFYFCETNVHPEFKGFEQTTGKDVATEILSIL